MQVRSLEIVVNIPSIDQFSRLALDLSTHCLCILNNPHLNASDSKSCSLFRALRLDSITENGFPVMLLHNPPDRPVLSFFF